MLGKDWGAAGDLSAGDEIYLLDGSTAVITGSELEQLSETIKVYNLEVEDFNTYFVGDEAVLVHNYNEADGNTSGTGNRPPNKSPEGAGRNGAFREAKRQNGIPVSQQPADVMPNVDRRGKRQSGIIYRFINMLGEIIDIRDDSAGHIFPDDPTQNRGPHFNDPAGNHYDY